MKEGQQIHGSDTILKSEQKKLPFILLKKGKTDENILRLKKHFVTNGNNLPAHHNNTKKEKIKEKTNTKT